MLLVGGNYEKIAIVIIGATILMNSVNIDFKLLFQNIQIMVHILNLILKKLT